MFRPLALSIAAALLAGSALTAANAADPAPRTVRLEPAPFEHRLDGEWRVEGRDADAPRAMVSIPRPVDLMALPVSVGDYAACVAEGACLPADGPADRPDLPVTGVSWNDASAYAAWLSDRTGDRWRLPSDVEWAQGAGSLYKDDALGVADDPANPAVRWLAAYAAETARARGRDRELRPVGRLNVNELGVHDIGGAVWEWTSTCLRRVEAAPDGRILRQNETCGIYIAEGLHRAAIIGFVRDPKTGGCSVGTPPEAMGFRLVREVPMTLRDRLRAWTGA